MIDKEYAIQTLRTMEYDFDSEIEDIPAEEIEDFIDYKMLISDSGQITLTCTISKKNLYQLLRMSNGKEPLKDGNNRWRTIMRAEQEEK